MTAETMTANLRLALAALDPPVTLDSDLFYSRETGYAAPITCADGATLPLRLQDRAVAERACTDPAFLVDLIRRWRTTEVHRREGVATLVEEANKLRGQYGALMVDLALVRANLPTHGQYESPAVLKLTVRNTHDRLIDAHRRVQQASERIDRFVDVQPKVVAKTA
jgi:hypothetical protein